MPGTTITTTNQPTLSAMEMTRPPNVGRSLNHPRMGMTVSPNRIVSNSEVSSPSCRSMLLSGVFLVGVFGFVGLTRGERRWRGSVCT